MKLVFFGTPKFAIPSLLSLHKSGHKILAVVTAPDKKKGRGLASKGSIVKEIALNFDSTKEPVYQEAHKFWDKYPKLFSGKYPLTKERLIEEVEKFSLGSTEKSEKILQWKAKINPKEGFKNSVNYARSLV